MQLRKNRKKRKETSAGTACGKDEAAAFLSPPQPRAAVSTSSAARLSQLFLSLPHPAASEVGVTNYSQIFNQAQNGTERKNQDSLKKEAKAKDEAMLLFNEAENRKIKTLLRKSFFGLASWKRGPPARTPVGLAGAARPTCCAR